MHQAKDIIDRKYQIIDLIGRGGSSITYSAISLDTKEKVAIKSLSLKGLSEWKQIELFEREAKILATLNHPAIPKYIDYFCLDRKDTKDFYIVQQLAPGKSLFQLVRDGWRTTEAEIKSITKQVLEILIYLHGLVPPVIHRDIKPQNIIRSDDGKIFLVDFGAVQNTYYTNLKQGSTVVGTYGYMAPEQFRGKAIPATDLYSLGATLVYLLTHHSPAELPHNNLKIKFRERVKISNQFTIWLERILEPNVADRFTSAESALSDLRSYSFETRESFKKFFNRKLNLVAVSLLASLSLGAVGLFTYLQPQETIVESKTEINIAELEKNPLELCKNPELIKYYLNNGGNPNLIVDLEKSSDYNLLFCNVSRIDGKNNQIVDVIRLLINKGANLEAKNYHNQTPLLFLLNNSRRISYHHSHPVKNQKSLVIDLLIDRGANIHIETSQGDTLLFLALEAGDRDTAKKLIDKGVNINAKNIYGITSLLQALTNNDRDIAEILIDKGANINVINKIGQTPLSIAVEKNSLKIVKLLISKGADVRTTDNNGNTILFKAAQKNNLEMVSFLLQQDIDINTLNHQNQTALFWLFKYNISYVEPSILNLFLAKGAKLNLKDNDGRTPLFYATTVRNISVSIIELLLKNKAKTDLVDNQGTSLLFNALYYKNWQVAKLLILNGANVNLQNNNSNFSPLFWTASNNNLEITELLLEKEADVNLKDRDGNTPLLRIISNHGSYNVEIIKLLIDNNTDLNAKNNQSLTVLSLLVDKNYRNNYQNNYHKSPEYLAFIELLIAKGADVNHQDKLGRSILVKAAYSGNQELVNLLKKYGAKY